MRLPQIGTETSICTPIHLTTLYPVGFFLSGPGSRPLYVSFQLLSSRRTWFSLLAPFLSDLFPVVSSHLPLSICFVTISSSFLARGSCNPYHLLFLSFPSSLHGQPSCISIHLDVETLIESLNLPHILVLLKEKYMADLKRL